MRRWTHDWTGGEALAALIFLPFVLLLVVGLTALSAVIVMWAWNLFMPLVWASAPKLTFWAAFAFGCLVSTLRGIFHFSINNNKS